MKILQYVFVTLGFIIGMYVSMKSSQTHSKSHASTGHHPSMNHDYVDISNDSIIPKIKNIKLFKDSMSGWNLHICTENFQFTPSKVGSKHTSSKGHAHLMINGNKFARVYSNWFHIPELGYKINELEVTLNTNSHAIMSINGKPIAIKLDNSEF